MTAIEIGDILRPLAQSLGLTETDLMRIARENSIATEKPYLHLLAGRIAGYRALIENAIQNLPDEQRPAVSIAMELMCATIYAERGMKEDLIEALEGAMQYAQGVSGTTHGHEALPQVISVCDSLLRSIEQ
jgi:hypothetical protein